MPCLFWHLINYCSKILDLQKPTIVSYIRQKVEGRLEGAFAFCNGV